MRLEVAVCDAVAVGELERGSYMVNVTAGDALREAVVGLAAELGE